MPPAKSAIINALLGGAGHEFVALGLKEVKNPLGVAAGFAGHTITQYTVPGLVVKQINLQSGYTGLPHDILALNIGGAVVLKTSKIELGAIVRGPFTTTPFATDIVFAINRGAGQRLGPYYASRPGITPDALVTVTVGPYGQNNSATITDLTTGTTQADQLAGDLGGRADGADPAQRQPAPVGRVHAEAIHVRGLDRDSAQCPDPGRGQLRAGGLDDPDRRRDQRQADALSPDGSSGAADAGRHAAEAASAGLSSPPCQIDAAGSPWISAASEA